MPTIDLGPIGAVLSPAEEGFVDTAAELERLGYATIWLTGGPMASLGQIADVVRATRSARIGTSIISVDRFAAEDVAARYRELENDQPGRFVVGLGGAHGAAPLGTLNAYLDRLAAVPATARVMAALGPRMLRLARDRASGAFPVLITPEYTAEARATLGDDTTLAVQQLVVLETDPDRARRIAHGPLDFLGKVPAYQASFRRMRFAEDEIVPPGDRLLDALVAWGDVSTIAARVAQHQRAGADHVAVNVVSASPAPALDEWRRLADALIAPQRRPGDGSRAE
jgi:probable F420-dependent oxidoreductase